MPWFCWVFTYLLIGLVCYAVYAANDYFSFRKIYKQNDSFSIEWDMLLGWTFLWPLALPICIITGIYN